MGPGGVRSRPKACGNPRIRKRRMECPREWVRPGVGSALVLPGLETLHALFNDLHIHSMTSSEKAGMGGVVNEAITWSLHLTTIKTFNHNGEATLQS